MRGEHKRRKEEIRHTEGNVAEESGKVKEETQLLNRSNIKTF